VLVAKGGKVLAKPQRPQSLRWHFFAIFARKIIFRNAN